MRILLAGGTGLIGRSLVMELHRLGHRVIILSRSPQLHRAQFPAAVQLAHWEPHEAGWIHLLEGQDAVINLAGASIGGKRWTGRRKQLILNSRTAATQALVKAVLGLRHKPGRFIQASAIGFYGPRSDEILTETAAPGDDFLSQVCQAWEHPVLQLEGSSIVPIIIRTGHVLDSADGALPSLSLPFRFYVGGLLGSGAQWMSWIHIVDEVRAILHLLENSPSRGVYNLTAPEPVTNRDFAAALGKALGRPSWFPLPDLLFRIVVGELAESLLTGQRVLPERLLAEEFQFNYPSLSRALKQLYP